MYRYGIKLTAQQNIMCVAKIEAEDKNNPFDMVIKMTGHPDNYGNGTFSLCFEKCNSNPFGEWEMTEAKGAWDWNTERSFVTMSNKEGAKHMFRKEFRRMSWEEMLSRTFQNIIDHIRLTNNATCMDLLDNIHKDVIMNTKSCVSHHDYQKLLIHYFEFVEQYNRLVQMHDLWDTMPLTLKRTISTTLDTLTERIKNISVKQ